LQCSDWLSQQTHLDVVTVSSNAKAAEKAASDKYGAALAGDLAADHYQLQRLHQNVENDSHNFTRFVVLGKQKTPPSGKDKTSLLIASANEPGELFKVLEPLAKEKINMTLIESHRYRHQQWRYMFFIDIDGHVTEEPVKKALSQLEKQKLELTVLGSYPKALLADESF